MVGQAGSSRPVDAADAADLRKGKGRDRRAQFNVYTMVSSEEPKKKRQGKLCKGLKYHHSHQQITSHNRHKLNLDIQLRWNIESTKAGNVIPPGHDCASIIYQCVPYRL